MLTVTTCLLLALAVYGQTSVNFALKATVLTASVNNDMSHQSIRTMQTINGRQTASAKIIIK